jgi:RNA polymerase sigma-70 factor (ECF subfamily)
VVQDTFLKAYKQLSRFESRANFGTWLHRIAVNCSIDLIRSRPHREAAHDAADLEQFGAGEPPTRTSLPRAADAQRGGAGADHRRDVGAQPDGRAAFVLRHFEGQSIDEISRRWA